MERLDDPKDKEKQRDAWDDGMERETEIRKRLSGLDFECDTCTTKGSKKAPEITPGHAAEEMSNQAADSEELTDAQNLSATHLDSSKVQPSLELTETSKKSRPGALDEKQREKLDWFSTWDED